VTYKYIALFLIVTALVDFPVLSRRAIAGVATLTLSCTAGEQTDRNYPIHCQQPIGQAVFGIVASTSDAPDAPQRTQTKADF